MKACESDEEGLVNTYRVVIKISLFLAVFIWAKIGFATELYDNQLSPNDPQLDHIKYIQPVVYVYDRAFRDERETFSRVAIYQAIDAYFKRYPEKYQIVYPRNVFPLLGFKEKNRVDNTDMNTENTLEIYLLFSIPKDAKPKFAAVAVNFKNGGLDYLSTMPFGFPMLFEIKNISAEVKRTLECELTPLLYNAIYLRSYRKNSDAWIKYCD
jgi:hypothetical protein